MKYKSIIIASALLVISSIACQAAPGLDARAAIPPDPPRLAAPDAAALAMELFQPLAITLAQSDDLIYIVIAPDAPNHLLSGIDILLEPRPDRVPGNGRSYGHVMPITSHGWYRATVHRPKCDWRLQSAWHPSGRSL